MENGWKLKLMGWQPQNAMRFLGHETITMVMVWVGSIIASTGPSQSTFMSAWHCVSDTTSQLANTIRGQSTAPVQTEWIKLGLIFIPNMVRVCFQFTVSNFSLAILKHKKVIVQIKYLVLTRITPGYGGHVDTLWLAYTIYVNYYFYRMGWG